MGKLARDRKDCGKEEETLGFHTGGNVTRDVALSKGFFVNFANILTHKKPALRALK